MTQNLDAGPIVGLVGIAVAIVIAVAQDWRRSRGEKRKAQDSNVNHRREEHEFDGVPLGARSRDYQLRQCETVNGDFMRGARGMPAEHPERLTQSSTGRHTLSSYFADMLSPARPEPAVLRGLPIASLGAPYDLWVRPERRADRDEFERPQIDAPAYPKSVTTHNSSERDGVKVLPRSPEPRMTFPLGEEFGTAIPASEVGVMEISTDEAGELGRGSPSPNSVAFVDFLEAPGRTHASAFDSHGECGDEVPAPAQEAMQDPLGAVDMNGVVCHPAPWIDGGHASIKDRTSPCPAAEVPLVEEKPSICGAPTMVDAGGSPMTSA